MTVEFARSDRVGRLTLAFDDLNRLTPDRMDEFGAAVAAVPDDVSVLVVAGERGLSAGLHLGEAVDYDAAAARSMFDSLYGAIEALRDARAVTVVDCGGFALGAGFEVALAGDFRVADADAALGLPEVDVGVPTVIHGGLLVEHVGLGRAKELVYTGETLSGEAAREEGLLHRVGDGEALVETLAAKAPATMELQKRAFRRWRSASREAGVEASAAEGALAFGTAAQTDAMRSFLDGDG
jgi:enoyl-CoA hydratase/carnithine racemase